MTATQTPLTVGTLVRVTNPANYCVGMTGIIIDVLIDVATVRMTSWHTDELFTVAELTPVRQPQVSA